MNKNNMNEIIRNRRAVLENWTILFTKICTDKATIIRSLFLFALCGKLLLIHGFRLAGTLKKKERKKGTSLSIVAWAHRKEKRRLRQRS